MNRTRALYILNLPENATQAQIDTAYDQLREFFYPAYYGSPHEFTANQIQEELCEYLSGNFYKKPKVMDYRHMVHDAYHHAFYNYTCVCHAYDYLTDPQYQNEFGVDPRSPYGHDVLRYGKAVADLRENTLKISCFLTKWAAIGYLAFGLIGLMSNDSGSIFSILAQVLKYVLILTHLVNWIAMPLDMLLMIPKMAFIGLQAGADIGSKLTRPLTACLLGALGGAFGAFCNMFNPRLVRDIRSSRYDPDIRSPKKARAMAAELYHKALANMLAFRLQQRPYIDDSIDVIRLEIEKIASQYQLAKNSLRSTELYYDDYVKRAEVMVNPYLTDDIEFESDNLCQALDKRNKETRTAEWELKKQAAVFFPYIQRMGADPEDYIAP